MLILSRKPSESLVIQDNIQLTILEIDGDKVKIGISAPKEISILRYEVWLAVQEQNKIAEQLSDNPAGDRFEALREYLASQTEE